MFIPYIRSNNKVRQKHKWALEMVEKIQNIETEEKISKRRKTEVK